MKRECNGIARNMSLNFVKFLVEKDVNILFLKLRLIKIKGVTSRPC